MKIKEKAKEFWNKHGIEIEAGLTVIGVAAVSGVIGYQLCSINVGKAGYVKLDKNIDKFLKNANEAHRGVAKHAHLWVAENTSEKLKLEDLGKLGEYMRHCDGVPFTDDFAGFTHIMSLGPGE